LIIVTVTSQPVPFIILLDNKLGTIVTVKVSFPSNRFSLIIGTLKEALVIPAVKVTSKGPEP